MDSINLYFFTIEGNIFVSIALLIGFIGGIIFFFIVAKDLYKHWKQEDGDLLTLDEENRKPENKQRSRTRRHREHQRREYSRP